MKTNAILPPAVKEKVETKLAETDIPAVVTPKPKRGRKKKTSTENPESA